jgi:hypothetical protein
VIDFRYHIVSLIAVFLALALGLFLGSTTLQSTVTNNLRHQADSVTGQNKKLSAQSGALSNQYGAERGFTAAIEPYVVSGRLEGDTVALISAPGVDGEIRKSVSNTLTLAGATVTADVQLQSAYLDPTQDDELGGLASELNVAGRTLPQGNGSTEVSSELANALVARPGRRQVARTHVANLLSALSVGKFVKVSGGPPPHAANLALMLVPGPPAGVAAATATAQNTIITTLAADLRASSSGLVVAGPTPVATAPGSALAAVQADPTISQTVSTVNLDYSDPNRSDDPPISADPAAGRIAIVLALAAAPSGVSGGFGLAPPNHGSPLPAISPTP